jgi:hypothetical protein
MLFLLENLKVAFEVCESELTTFECFVPHYNIMD